jgi:UDP-N-acetylglucosamine 2-epimerase (non-hydrolysing)
VEAGLRTHDLKSPFPEEANRQLISRIACFHFAPTVQAAMALEKENLRLADIFTVGNTSIDALKWALNHLGDQKLTEIQDVPLKVAQFAEMGRYLVVTAHRRESFGVGFEGICDGILGLIERVPDLRVIYPVHPNPQVKNAAERRLGAQSRILLCDPLPYVGFLALLRSAAAILTDSGGVQEEAPSLRVPILVLREKTERPEGVESGFSKLVGTHSSRIIEATLSALSDEKTTQGENPYGDGQSAARMIKLVEERIYAK